jgi:hypothetical protein
MTNQEKAAIDFSPPFRKRSPLHPLQIPLGYGTGGIRAATLPGGRGVGTEVGGKVVLSRLFSGGK